MMIKCTAAIIFPTVGSVVGWRRGLLSYYGEVSYQGGRGVGGEKLQVASYYVNFLLTRI